MNGPEKYIDFVALFNEEIGNTNIPDSHWRGDPLLLLENNLYCIVGLSLLKGVQRAVERENLLGGVQKAVRKDRAGLIETTRQNLAKIAYQDAGLPPGHPIVARGLSARVIITDPIDGMNNLLAKPELVHENVTGIYESVIGIEGRKNTFGFSPDYTIQYEDTGLGYRIFFPPSGLVLSAVSLNVFYFERDCDKGLAGQRARKHTIRLLDALAKSKLSPEEDKKLAELPKECRDEIETGFQQNIPEYPNYKYYVRQQKIDGLEPLTPPQQLFITHADKTLRPKDIFGNLSQDRDGVGKIFIRAVIETLEDIQRLAVSFLKEEGTFEKRLERISRNISNTDRIIIEFLTPHMRGFVQNHGTSPAQFDDHDFLDTLTQQILNPSAVNGHFRRITVYDVMSPDRPRGWIKKNVVIPQTGSGSRDFILPPVGTIFELVFLRNLKPRALFDVLHYLWMLDLTKAEYDELRLTGNNDGLLECLAQDLGTVYDMQKITAELQLQSVHDRNQEELEIIRKGKKKEDLYRQSQQNFKVQEFLQEVQANRRQTSVTPSESLPPPEFPEPDNKAWRKLEEDTENPAAVSLLNQELRPLLAAMNAAHARDADFLSQIPPDAVENTGLMVERDRAQEDQRSLQKLYDAVFGDATTIQRLHYTHQENPDEKLKNSVHDIKKKTEDVRAVVVAYLRDKGVTAENWQEFAPQDPVAAQILKTPTLMAVAAGSKMLLEGYRTLAVSPLNMRTTLAETVQRECIPGTKGRGEFAWAPPSLAQALVLMGLLSKEQITFPPPPVVQTVAAPVPPVVDAPVPAPAEPPVADAPAPEPAVTEPALVVSTPVAPPPTPPAPTPVVETPPAKPEPRVFVLNEKLLGGPDQEEAEKRAVYNEYLRLCGPDGDINTWLAAALDDKRPYARCLLDNSGQKPCLLLEFRADIDSTDAKDEHVTVHINLPADNIPNLADLTAAVQTHIFNQQGIYPRRRKIGTQHMVGAREPLPMTALGAAAIFATELCDVPTGDANGRALKAMRITAPDAQNGTHVTVVIPLGVYADDPSFDARARAVQAYLAEFNPESHSLPTRADVIAYLKKEFGKENWVEGNVRWRMTDDAEGWVQSGTEDDKDVSDIVMPFPAKKVGQQMALRRVSLRFDTKAVTPSWVLNSTIAIGGDDITSHDHRLHTTDLGVAMLRGQEVVDAYTTWANKYAAQHPNAKWAVQGKGKQAFSNAPGENAGREEFHAMIATAQKYEADVSIVLEAQDVDADGKGSYVLKVVRKNTLPDAERRAALLRDMGVDVGEIAVDAVNSCHKKKGDGALPLEIHVFGEKTVVEALYGRLNEDFIAAVEVAYGFRAQKQGGKVATLEFNPSTYVACLREAWDKETHAVPGQGAAGGGAAIQTTGTLPWDALDYKHAGKGKENPSLAV